MKEILDTTLCLGSINFLLVTWLMDYTVYIAFVYILESEKFLSVVGKENCNSKLCWQTEEMMGKPEEINRSKGKLLHFSRN